MITPITEGQHTGEFVLVEPYGELLRQEVTVILGQNLVAGAVLGKITASGKYTEMDPAALDGSQVAAGVLYADVDAIAADTEGLAVVQQVAVQRSKLVWITGITGPEQTTAEGELETATVFVR